MGTSAFLLTSITEGTYTLDLSRRRLRPMYISGNPVLAPVAAEGRHTIAHVARRGFPSPSPTSPVRGDTCPFRPPSSATRKMCINPRRLARVCYLTRIDSSSTPQPLGTGQTPVLRATRDCPALAPQHIPQNLLFPLLVTILHRILSEQTMPRFKVLCLWDHTLGPQVLDACPRSPTSTGIRQIANCSSPRSTNTTHTWPRCTSGWTGR